ncbi:MAG: hypothetical protein AAFR38_00380 [Planctomycetota bacterium]
MAGWVVILIVGFVVFDVLLIAGLFIWLGARARSGEDNAPGWYLICTECGRVFRRLL